MRLGVAGLAGRMGRLVAEEVLAAGAVLTGGTVGPGDAPAHGPVLQDFRALADISDAIIDFTHASTARAHAEAIACTGTAWILGTTGLAPEDQHQVNAAAARAAIVQAANFSPGVNLVLALAESLARALPAGDYDAEILEMHHRQKLDAPSGTALALGRAVAAGRGQKLEDVAQLSREGHTGPRRPGAIGFATLRGGQVVGEHKLLFASGAEHITLSHSVLDRRVFAQGAVRAALWTRDRPAGLYHMTDVLGLTA